MLKSLFIKVTGLRVCNFIKKRIQRRCFPVNFERTLSFYRTLTASLNGLFENHSNFGVDWYVLGARVTMLNPFNAKISFLYPLYTFGFPMFLGEIDETLALNDSKNYSWPMIQMLWSFNSFMTEVSIYRNQPTELQSKSMDWFLYDRVLRHERVKSSCLKMLEVFYPGVIYRRLIFIKLQSKFNVLQVMLFMKRNK